MIYAKAKRKTAHMESLPFKLVCNDHIYAILAVDAKLVFSGPRTFGNGKVQTRTSRMKLDVDQDPING